MEIHHPNVVDVIVFVRRESFAKLKGSWKKMYDSARPEEFADLPKEWQKLNPFERLLVLRCIRQDRCQPALQVRMSGRCESAHHAAGPLRSASSMNTEYFRIS